MKMQTDIHPLEEYTDALVTCELAVMMAIKYGKEPNFSVRMCAARMSLKCSNPMNKKLFFGVSKSHSPATLIYHFRTMLDEELSK